MIKHIILILVFITCSCNIAQCNNLEMAEIETVVLQDLINLCLTQDNIKIMNIKLDTDNDNKKLNVLIHKVKFPNLILRLDSFNNNSDLKYSFIDGKGRRMVYFEIFQPKNQDDTIRINASYKWDKESDGLYETGVCT